MLSKRTTIGFGLGHVGNDLVVTLWFSYLLIFLNQVIGLDPVYAGVPVASGQFIDAIVVLAMGHIIDHYAPFKRFINRKKFWHVIGTVTITLVYPMLFIPPPGYDPTNLTGLWRSQATILSYYMIWVVLFATSWATIQISHLTMTGDLTRHDDERVFLTSIRNAATVLSSIVVHLSAMLLFSFKQEDNKEPSETFANGTSRVAAGTAEVNGGLNWLDRKSFSYMAVGSVLLGLFTSCVFYILIPSRALIPSNKIKLIAEMQESERTTKLKSDWQLWFKRDSFYTLTLLYLLVRLIFNMIMSYVPFWLQLYLHSEKTFVARVPLIQFTSGFLASFAMKPLTQRIGKTATFLIGCLFLIVATLVIGSLDTVSEVGLYFLSVAIGIGTSVILIQALVSPSVKFAINSQST